MTPAQFLEYCAIFGVTTGGGGGSGYLPLTGGTLTGTLTLASGANLDVSDITRIPQAWYYDLVNVSFGITHTTTNAFYVMNTAATTCSDSLGVATYSPGVVFGINNISAGDVTFLPNSPDTIDGNVSLTVPSQTSVIIMAAATQWSTIAQANFGGGGGGVTSIQVQQGAFNFGTDSGTGSAYVVACSPAITGSYADAMIVSFVPLNNNATNTPTLNAGAGAHTITYNGNTLVTGDIGATYSVSCQWSASRGTWQLLNPRSSIILAYDIQRNVYTSGTDTGAANSYDVNPSNAVAFYTDNMVIQFIPAHSNTSASTLNISGVAAAAIVKQGQAALVAGDLVAGTPAVVIYSTVNSNWLLLNPQSASSASASQVQANAFNNGVDAGTANTYSTTLSPAVVTLTNGLPVSLLAVANSNTGASTLDVNGTPVSIHNLQGAALSGGEMLAGYNYNFVYDTANSWFVLQNSSLASGGGGVTSAQVQSSAFNSATDAGVTANAYVGVYSPVVASLTGGIFILNNIAHANTASSTLDVGTGAIAIVNNMLSPLVGGELLAGVSYAFLYDPIATDFIILNSSLLGAATSGLQVQQSAFNLGLDSGIADAYVVDLTPTVTSLTNGLPLQFTPLNTNATANPTVQVNAVSPTAILLANGQPVAPGDLNTASLASMVYAAGLGGFILLNPYVSFVSGYDVQQQKFTYAIDSSGSANAIVLALAPPIVSNGVVNVTFQCANTNTGATTIDVGFGAIPLVTNTGALVGGELLTGGTYSACYNAAVNSYVLFNSSLSGGGGGVTAAQIQGNAFTSAVDTGVTNAYVVSLTPPLGSYSNFASFWFTTPNTSSGNCTINVNSLGVTDLLDTLGHQLPPGAIVAGVPYQVIVYAGVCTVVNPSPVAIAFGAYSNSTTTLAASSFTKVQFQIKEFDMGDNYDNVTNYRFVAPLNGIYHFDSLVTVNDANVVTTSMYNVSLYINGSEYKQGNQGTIYNGASSTSNISVDVQLSGGDYVEIYCQNNNSVTTVGTDATQITTWFSGYYIGNGGSVAGATPQQVQQQSFTSTPDVGVADAYVLDFSPAVTAFTDNFLFMFSPANSNATTTPTVKFNSLSTVTIVKAGGAVAVGDIVAGKNAICLYSLANNNVELINPQGVAGAPTPVIDPNYLATYFYPVATPAINASNTITKNHIYFTYIGYVAQSVTINYVTFNCASGASWSGGSIDVGLCSSSQAPNSAGGSPTLTLLASERISSLGGGVNHNSTPLGYTVAAGTYLWAACSGSAAVTGNASMQPLTIDPQSLSTAQFSGDFLSSGATSWATSVIFPTTNSTAVVCPYMTINT